MICLEQGQFNLSSVTAVLVEIIFEAVQSDSTMEVIYRQDAVAFRVGLRSLPVEVEFLFIDPQLFRRNSWNSYNHLISVRMTLSSPVATCPSFAGNVGELTFRVLTSLSRTLSVKNHGCHNFRELCEYCNAQHLIEFVTLYFIMFTLANLYTFYSGRTFGPHSPACGITLKMLVEGK